MTPAPTLHDILLAGKQIVPFIQQTPCTPDGFLAKHLGATSVHLKLECLQNTGSFKVRGAANKICSLNDPEKARGVITFSTGNHGKAVAYVASKLKIPSLVCLSEHVPSYRQQAIRNLGAKLSIKGHSQDEAEQNYEEQRDARQLSSVVPFDDPYIIAGQGTIGLEILEALPKTDVLLIQLSGGGLLGGIAMTAKSINPAIHIIGISITQSPAMLECIKACKTVQIEEKESIADSLLGGIGKNNRYTFDLINKYVDEHLLVTEEEIRDGMFYLFEQHRLIVEGGGAVGVAALLHKKIALQDKRVVTLLSGSSIQSDTFIKIIYDGLGQGDKSWKKQ